MHNFGHAYLVKRFDNELLHVMVSLRSPELVALEHFTGTTEKITRWLPSSCEYWITPGRTIRDKKEIIRNVMKGIKPSLMNEILDIVGNDAVMPIPVDGCEIISAVIETLHAFHDSIDSLYTILAAIIDRRYYLRETDDSIKGQPSFDLRSCCDLSNKKFSLNEDPRGKEELIKTILHLGQCTICSSSHVVGGGILTPEKEKISTVYALCRSCLDDPDHYERLEARLTARRSVPEPTVSPPEVMQ